VGCFDVSILLFAKSYACDVNQKIVNPALADYYFPGERAAVLAAISPARAHFSVAALPCSDTFHISHSLVSDLNVHLPRPPFESPSTFETIEVLRRIGFSSTRTFSRPAGL
jgi:hypothetical protein